VSFCSFCSKMFYYYYY